MQVPQWAGPIPMGQRGGPGLSAISGGWGQCPRTQNSCLELVGGSGITSRAMLISVNLHRVIVDYYGYLNKTA